LIIQRISLNIEFIRRSDQIVFPSFVEIADYCEGDPILDEEKRNAPNDIPSPFPR